MPRTFANGLHLHYESQGSGPALVLLSGLGGDHRSFSLAMKGLANEYRAIALDNRDAGSSDRTAAAYTTADMARDVLGLLGSLGIAKAHLVGHSLGGLVAQQVALMEPKCVNKLILVSTFTGEDPWRRAILESWTLLRERTTPAEFTRATLPYLVAAKFFRGPAQVEGLVRFAERNERPQDAAAFARQAHAAWSHKPVKGLENITAKTLVLSGECDLVNPPRYSRALSERIPGAKLMILPEVGHLPHIESGTEFRAAIEGFVREGA